MFPNVLVDMERSPFAYDRTFSNIIQGTRPLLGSERSEVQKERSHVLLNTRRMAFYSVKGNNKHNLTRIEDQLFLPMSYEVMQKMCKVEKNG